MTDVSRFVPDQLDAERLKANLEDSQRNVAQYEQASKSAETAEEREYWAAQAVRERASIDTLEKLIKVKREAS